MGRIDIVMLTHNRLKYLKRTIGCLVKNTKHPYRLIVVDNASERQVTEYLRNLQKKGIIWKLILGKENIGVPGFNAGIKFVRSDPFILTDPDILVPKLEPDWLTQMLTTMKENPAIGVSAVNLDSRNKPPFYPSTILSVKRPYSKEVTPSFVGTWMKMIRRDVYNQIGEYTRDALFCQRAIENGWLVGFANNIYALHLGWEEYKDYPEFLLKKKEIAGLYRYDQNVCMISINKLKVILNKNYFYAILFKLKSISQCFF